MKDDLITNLNKVLYSADHSTVENLLTQLASPEHLLTRTGHPSRSDFRGVLADALQDTGRDEEAGHLRSGRHVVVHEGKVVPGRFSSQGVIDRLHQLAGEHNNTYHDPTAFRIKVEPAEDGRIVTTRQRPYDPPVVKHRQPENLHARLAHTLNADLEHQLDADTINPEGVGEMRTLIQSLSSLPLEEPIPEGEHE